MRSEMTSEKTWRITDILNWSTQYLKKKKIDQPRLTSEILLANTLNCRRIDLYLKFDQPLNMVERRCYRQLLKSRAQGKPWQYLTGRIEFFSLPFEINEAVLIPRPETEILIEKVLSYLGKNDYLESPIKAWDIGTGSGVIAVSLARHLPRLTVLATDISSAVLSTARANAELNGVLEQIQFKVSDLAENIGNVSFDLIISNPPYISTAELKSLPIEIRYEPVIALDGGKKGLEFYRQFAEIACNYLSPGGILALEIGAEQGNEIKTILKTSSIFSSIQIFKDYAFNDRVVLAIKKRSI